MSGGSRGRVEGGGGVIGSVGGGVGSGRGRVGGRGGGIVVRRVGYEGGGFAEGAVDEDEGEVVGCVERGGLVGEEVVWVRWGPAY